MGDEKSETRGRPRKKQSQKLPQISRQLFSQHCAVFYACCMVYVLQLFLNTKNQKRIGHSQGGFIIYEKINDQYSFQQFQQHIKKWGFYQEISKCLRLSDYLRIINGCAPSFVFRELVHFIIEIYKFINKYSIENIEELENMSNKMFIELDSQNNLNKLYKYVRFSSAALKQLKLQKWTEIITNKIEELWPSFVIIISYTVFCVVKDIEHNKYLHPFFSDAQHPQDTIIGQLNLQQIVEQCNHEKYIFQLSQTNRHQKKTTHYALKKLQINKQMQQKSSENIQQQQQSINNNELQQYENYELQNYKRQAPIKYNQIPITLIKTPSCHILQNSQTVLDLNNEDHIQAPIFFERAKSAAATTIESTNKCDRKGQSLLLFDRPCNQNEQCRKISEEEQDQKKQRKKSENQQKLINKNQQIKIQINQSISSQKQSNQMQFINEINNDSNINFDTNNQNQNNIRQQEQSSIKFTTHKKIKHE